MKTWASTHTWDVILMNVKKVLTNSQHHAIIKKKERGNKMSCEKCPYDDNGWCSFEGAEMPNDAECFIEKKEE